MNQKRYIALTMGDACGIGPEIIAKTILKNYENNNNSHYCYVVFGSVVVMQHIVEHLGLDLNVLEIKKLEDAVFSLKTINVIECTKIITPLPFGEINAIAGKAAYDSIITAIENAKAGHVQAIVTAPIHKEALSLAGVKYPGHTEILADFGGSKDFAMMLANEDIITVLVTIHMSLRKAIDAADFNAQMRAMRLAHQGGLALGIKNPRIAVAGLNPHAGEGGLFGDEEIKIIKPAIEKAKKEGINATGPWPGDTVYMQARKGAFDIVVAQYHDQGLIPVKYLGLEKGVNITLGLPFVRTSPDHGTAFDIAGKNIAEPDSLQTAILYAQKLYLAQHNQND